MYYIQNKYLNEIKSKVEQFKKLGVIEYILSDIFQKGMVFIGSFIIVRILSKEDYGNYSYIQNIFGIFSLTGDIGISAAVLQYASVHYENDEKRKAYIRYGQKVLLIVSLLSVVFILLGTKFYRFSMDRARSLFGMLFLLPVFNNEILYFQSILRVELRNKEYARINILSTMIHYLSLIGLAVLAGLKGAVVASYPEAVIVLAIYMITVKPELTYFGNESLSRQEKKKFWKFAVLMQVNQTSLALLNYLDIYCIGITVKNPEVIAEYKVASAIPTALYFVPKSIMFFMVPIMGRRKEDLKWTWRTFKKLMFVNAFFSVCIAAVFALGSELLIRLIYGEQYLNSVTCFLILLAGFIIYGTLQSPSSNILSIHEKLNMVLLISVAGAVLNIVLNILLINKIGSAGAAIATVSSHFFIGMVLTGCVAALFRKKI